jgi:hypothetical protein
MLISMAMADATKLFDKSGGKASGNKQDAVNGAASTVMKLLVQSKFGVSAWREKRSRRAWWFTFTRGFQFFFPEQLLIFGDQASKLA